MDNVGVQAKKKKNSSIAAGPSARDTVKVITLSVKLNQITTQGFPLLFLTQSIWSIQPLTKFPTH